MGGERIGKRKHVLRCVAFVACLFISSCAFVEGLETKRRLSQEGPRLHLDRAQKLLGQGVYEASLRENQIALSLSGNKPPGDEALYNMGMLYVHPANPEKDYAKSIDAFTQLITDYPKGSWTEWAKVWVSVIREADSMKRASTAAVQEYEKLKRAYAEALQENEKLKRASTAAVQEYEKLKRAYAEALHENERLKRVIEESAKVDIEIEEKKKEKTR